MLFTGLVRLSDKEIYPYLIMQLLGRSGWIRFLFSHSTLVDAAYTPEVVCNNVIAFCGRHVGREVLKPTFTKERFYNIAGKMLICVRYMHEVGLIHRDIKVG